MAIVNLDEEQVAVRVHKRASTIYNWQKKGIEFLDWVGLLAVVGLLDVEDEKLLPQLRQAGLTDDQAVAFVEDRRDARAAVARH